jgi:hypothetical protein
MQAVMSLCRFGSVRRMNRQGNRQRMSSVAGASVARDDGDEADLAGAVHQILATLADVRRDTPATELRDRIALLQWLRVELAAVETLLTDAYGRRAGTADATPTPGRTR